MVQGSWINNKLIIKNLTKEDELNLPSFVKETLDLDLVAVSKGIAYANNEQTMREMLE